MPKLVAATSHECAGMRDPKSPIQIESDNDGSFHDIGVQHFDDGTTRVLCSHFKDGLCQFLHRENKVGELDLTKKGASCPFKVGSIGESK